MSKIMSIFVFSLVLQLSSALQNFDQEAFAQDVTIPNYWDEAERFQKPDMKAQPRLRFLTTTDFPPFNFIDRKKRLTGLHVDLARAICAELEVLNRCEIQALPWGDLKKAMENGEGDAILAGIAISEETRKHYAFSRPYLRVPARFVVRKDSALEGSAYDALFRKKIGVVTGSNHSGYFAEVFSARTPVEFETRDAALQALQKQEIDAVFSDALSLSFWLASAASDNCCEFLDGAFESQKHFGAGLSVALPKGNQDMVDAMNYALKEINQKGTFAELYLRYFPLGLY
ncbi:MAG: transporter substrate-binding domain-containing protein [Rhizobiaceae bacterium]|nr:transporter substrate-binding domain-containing protein [Rhizobiaceae bacterium]